MQKKTLLFGLLLLRLTAAKFVSFVFKQSAEYECGVIYSPRDFNIVDPSFEIHQGHSHFLLVVVVVVVVVVFCRCFVFFFYFPDATSEIAMPNHQFSVT